MLMLDVNVLVHAHRRESPEHEAYAAWLKRLATAPEPFALSELAMSRFLRVVTNPRIYVEPTPLPQALAFLAELQARPTCRCLRPRERHFEIFVGLCKASKATGKLAADAYHAALAIESGCEWVTADADFGRFDGLRVSHPLRQRALA